MAGVPLRFRSRGEGWGEGLFGPETSSGAPRHLLPAQAEKGQTHFFLPERVESADLQPWGSRFLAPNALARQGPAGRAPDPRPAGNLNPGGRRRARRHWHLPLALQFARLLGRRLRHARHSAPAEPDGRGHLAQRACAWRRPAASSCRPSADAASGGGSRPRRGSRTPPRSSSCARLSARRGCGAPSLSSTG